MAGPTQSASAGNNYSFIAWYDTNNDFITGGTRTAPTAGDQNGSAATRVLGIKTAAPTVGDPEPVQITGDDGLVAEITFENIDTRQFIVNVAVQDLDLVASMNNVTRFSEAGASFISLDTDDVDDRNAFLIVQSKAEDVENGQSVWSGVYVLTGTTRFLGRETFEEREAATYRFAFTPKRSDYLPWGVTFASSAQGTSRARYLPFSSEHPLHVQAFTGDGVEAEFILKHDAVGLTDIAAWQDRVELTIDSFNATTNTITFNTAPTANRPVFVLYQFDRFNA